MEVIYHDKQEEHSQYADAKGYPETPKGLSPLLPVAPRQKYRVQDAGNAEDDETHPQQGSPGGPRAKEFAQDCLVIAHTVQARVLKGCPTQKGQQHDAAEEDGE